MAKNKSNGHIEASGGAGHLPAEERAKARAERAKRRLEAEQAKAKKGESSGPSELRKEAADKAEESARRSAGQKPGASLTTSSGLK